MSDFEQHPRGSKRDIMPAQSNGLERILVSLHNGAAQTSLEVLRIGSI